LAGTHVVGNPSDDSNHWSIKFDDLVFDEMLFMTGDQELWMIIDKQEVIGEYYDCVSKTIK